MWRFPFSQEFPPKTNYFQLFVTPRADRRPLFHNRAQYAFLEGIGFEIEKSFLPTGQPPRRDIDVNVFLQYIAGIPPKRVMSLDLDSLHRIVDAVIPIIYPALERRTLPPNTITAEMIADATCFHIRDTTGILHPEPPRSPPSLTSDSVSYFV